MSFTLLYWIAFLAIGGSILMLDLQFGMLRDMGSMGKKGPYSWSRVQLAFWITIIMSSIAALFYKNGGAPVLDGSIIMLLGISTATTAVARVIDVSDLSKDYLRHQDELTDNFLLDIISDENGASIHRFQALVVNVIFGVGFIYDVLHNSQMTAISSQYLALLGVSSATYAAIKSTENKTEVQPDSPGKGEVKVAVVGDTKATSVVVSNDPITKDPVAGPN